MPKVRRFFVAVTATALASSFAVAAPPAHAADLDAAFVGMTTDTTPFCSDPVPYTSGGTMPTFETDQVFCLAITMKNVGTATWGTPALALPTVSYLTRSPDFNTSFGPFYLSASQGAVIAPGENQMNISGLRAPSTPGVYTMTWQAAEWDSIPNDPSSAAFFGPQMTLTVNVVARTDSPPPTPSKVPGVIDSSDFQYVGSFALPDVPTASSDEKTYFNSGLTLRKVGGEERMILATGTYDQTLYEVAIPTPVKVVGSDISNVPVAPLRTTFGPLPIVPDADSNGGMWYDQATDQLYWTNYVWYTAQVPQTNPTLQAGSIAGGTLVKTSDWYEPDPRSTPQSAFWGGVTPIPQDFANQYTGGKTLGMGFGGNNLSAANSPGPALAAVDVSGPSGSTMVEQPIFSYLWAQYGTTAGQSPRDGNYLIGRQPATYAQPASPWQGYWTYGDRVGSGVFIDLPGQQGYVAFTQQIVGRVAYDFGGYIWNPSTENVWYFYDYQTLGKAATGQIAGYDVAPSSTTTMDLPNTATSANQWIAGSAFDPTTRLLYVYAMRAVGLVGCCSQPPLVDVYYVTPDLQSIAVTTPPSKTSYVQGDALDLAGMKVTATYTDGSTKDVTASVTTDPASGTALSAVGNQTVQVSYTDTGLTQTANFPITVTAPLAPLSSDSTLASLSVDPGPLAPAFSAGVTNYSVNVANAVASVTVKAVANDSAAVIVGAGVHTVAVGKNQITVTVTAADGTKTVYTITVTRAPPPPPAPAPAPVMTASAAVLTVATGGSVAGFGPWLFVALILLGIGLVVNGLTVRSVRRNERKAL